MTARGGRQRAPGKSRAGVRAGSRGPESGPEKPMLDKGKAAFDLPLSCRQDGRLVPRRQAVQLSACASSRNCAAASFTAPDAGWPGNHGRWSFWPAASSFPFPLAGGMATIALIFDAGVGR